MPDQPDRFSPTRPGSSDTRSNRFADSLDRVDVPALGTRKVVTQALHDLFGTKDVQNVITASYVWLADQLGHLTLGLVPTLLACWVIGQVGRGIGLTSVVIDLVMAAAAMGIFAYWVRKEMTDLAETRVQAGRVFPFDRSDIVWNIRTALLYFGIGGLLGLSAFLNAWLFLGVLLVSLWPAAMVAYWWLRRKLAFQQAGLPYLYRLANFRGVFDRPEARSAVAVASGLCDLRERPVSTWHVLLGRDQIVHREPRHRHLLVTGPLRSGKTSLAVGIGTEFAFVLGLTRYLSAVGLVEFAALNPEQQPRMDYDDGRVLWPWNEVGLLIVDDIDAGVAVSIGSGQIQTICNLVRPDDFVAAMRSASGKEQPLSWLRDKRSVWVIGDPSSQHDWCAAITKLMGAEAREMLTMELSASPPAPPPGSNNLASSARKVAGYTAGVIGLALLSASVAWWAGEERWGAFQSLSPGQAFQEGTLGLELAPLKYMLVAGRLSASALERPGGPAWPRRFGFLQRPNASAGMCEGDAPGNLPVGFGVSNRLPGNATPVPLRFVGLTCAACHAAELGKAGVVIGAGSHSADVIAFTDAFLTAVMDPALSGETVLDAYNKQCPGEAGGLSGLLRGPLERLLINRWLSGARAQARENETKYDLPFSSPDLGDPGHIPTGPSRTRPFRSVVRNTFDLPGADNLAYSKVPVAALQDERPWSQFDGSVGNPVVRSLVAVFTSGASVAALHEPQIAYNIEQAAVYTLRLGESPAWPHLRDAFPNVPQPTPETLAAGRTVWDAHCSSCHSPPRAGGPSITPLTELGTDAHRLSFRYAEMLPAALAGVLPMRDTLAQDTALGRGEATARIEGDYARADWFTRARERLAKQSRIYPAGHRRAFPPQEIAYRGGFLNAPIPFAWMRAPYLHNGSVPTLRALVGLDGRPTQFCRGNAGYDPVAIGVRAPSPVEGKCPPEAPFMFDTSQPGNSAEGHRYPAPGTVPPAELEALLAYVGTL